MTYVFLSEHFELLKNRVASVQSAKTEKGKLVGEAAGMNSDWHDNAGFDTARAEFELDAQRLGELQRILAGAQVVPKHNDQETVGFSRE